MSKQNQEGYQTLGWIINKSEYGLFLVVADEPIQREIAEIYRGGMIGVYDYKRYPGEYSFQVLEDWIHSSVNIQTFFIVNFQLAIQSERDLGRLNFSRDMLAGLGKNLIFFTTEYGDDKLAVGAYDFYSFIRIRIIFHNYVLEDKIRNLKLTLEKESEQGEEAKESRETVKQKLSEAYSLVQEAEENNDKADYYGGIKLLLKAREIYEKILGPEHLETASVYCELAYAYEKQYAWKEAEELCHKALEIRKKILGEDHPDVARCYDILACIYEGQGRYEEAEKLGRQALFMSETLLGSMHPYTTECSNDLALIYADQGKYEEAEALFKKAMTVYEKAEGKNHLNLGLIYNNLACMYKEQEKYEEAKIMYRKTLSVYKRMLGENDPDVATIYDHLADICGRRKRYEEAKELYQKAFSIRETALGKNHPDTAVSYNNLANVYANQGKYEEAEKLYEKALSVSKSVLGENHHTTRLIYNNLARVRSYDK